MDLKSRIIASVCVFSAFVFAVLAAAAPVYRHTVKKEETKASDYDGNSEVIVGSDGFLFRAYGEDSDEYGDFTGRNFYTSEELENTVSALRDTENMLGSANCRSLFVFIPSKMSVYADKLPENVRSKKAASNKFTQITEAARGEGLDVLDLTGEFSRIKNENLLFHTCSDSLNDVGGFYLYNAVCEKLNGSFGLNMKKAKIGEYNVKYSLENNHPLTREYRNETGVTVSNKTYTFEEKKAAYVVSQTVSGSATSTRVPEENKTDGCDYPNICLFDTGAAGSCGKFFSSSASLCVYSPKITPDGAVISAAKPDIAVFLIYESELYRLPAKESPADVDKEKTSVPSIKASAFSDFDEFVIFGSCEKNCTVTVYGGAEIRSAYSYDGDFCIEVPVSDIVTGLTVCAKADGKAESDKAEVTARYSGEGYKNVVVGLDGHLHYEETLPDYLGTNRLSQSEIDGYVGYMKAKAERIHAVSPDTEIIYVIAPNHLTVYPETAPERLAKERAGGESKLDQLLAAFENIDYVKFIDLKTPLLEAKKTAPFRLYNKTDTHWNELGAYYAYSEIMKYVSEKFPAAAPDPLGAFNVYTADADGGDLANFLGVDLSAVKEHGVYVRAKNGLQSGIVKDHSMNFANAWFSDMHEFRIGKEGLPSMIMYRDSFSTNLMSFLAEKFSYSRFAPMWEYPEELDLYEEIKPDYIIYEFVERNLGGLR